MKVHGIATTEEDYQTLKEFFGKIQIRVEHGVDLLYVYNDFLGRRVYYSCNPALVADQIRKGIIKTRVHKDWPEEWK